MDCARGKGLSNLGQFSGDGQDVMIFRLLQYFINQVWMSDIEGVCADLPRSDNQRQTSFSIWPPTLPRQRSDSVSFV